MPLVEDPLLNGDDLNARGERWIFEVMGYLKPGVTTTQAIADLNRIGAALEKAYPKDEGKMTFVLTRPSLYGDYLGKPVKAFMAGLMLLTGMILLAACANLGSLFAARAADRSKEVALRLALGSTRSRILRGLLTEAMMISVAGGGIGLLGSVALLRALSAWQPFPDWPIQLSLRGGKGGDGNESRKAVQRARDSAGGADCDLRGAGDVVAGCGAGTGAVARCAGRV